MTRPKMPAPKPPREGRRGRPANAIVFPDPDVLWQRWLDFDEWVKDPDNLIEIGSRGRRVRRPKTIPGFAAYLQCGEKTVRRAADRADLRETWSAIEAEIHAGLIEGGMLKTLDGHLVARVARLAEHQVVETTNNEPAAKYDWSRLTAEELETVTALLAKAEIED